MNEDQKSVAEQIKSDTALYHATRAHAYYDEGDFDRAIADYSEALRRWPNLAWCYYWRARAYSPKGETQRADAEFDEAKRVVRYARDNLIERGLLHEKREDIAFARVDFEAALLGHHAADNPERAKACLARLDERTSPTSTF